MALAGGSAFAQEAAQETASTASGMGDIVVTASRREQNLQDVGVSVTALSAEALSSLGVRQTTDIVAQVPGLKFNAYSPSITVFNIRGVSQESFDDHIEPPVAMYIDDAYVAVAGLQGVPSFDIARVEVLRGPQGTLFGRNATGGLIHFISARPTKEWEGFVDVIGGTRGHFNAEAAIGGPISDKAQFRLSGVYNYREGYIKNDIGKDAGGLNNYGIRAQLALQPTENLNILFIGRYANNKNEKQGTGTAENGYYDSDGLGYKIGPNDDPWGTCAGCNGLGYKDADGDPYTISAEKVGTFNRKVWGAQGRLEWEVGNATITSITDYQKFRKLKLSDDDGTPDLLFDDTYYARYHQISEELRASGDLGRFRWTSGLYYLHMKSTEGVELISAPFGIPGMPFDTGYDAVMRSTTWSIFGQVEYDITPKLTFIGGLRYVEDDRKADIHQYDNFGSDFRFNTSTDPRLAHIKYSDYSARAQLNYKVNDDVLVYASFNRGIKGPNFIAPLFAPADPVEYAKQIPHGGETLLSYEAGIKSSWFDNKVRFNLSAFYYDYKDYQAYIYLNATSAIRNVPATIKGLEAELTIAPVTGLTISGGLSVLDSKVKEVGLPFGRVISTEMPQAPELSGNLLARYETPVSQGLKAAIQFDMTFTDDFKFGLFPSQINREPSYAVGNLRLSVADIDDKWTFAVFAKNLWNEKYRLYTLDSAQFYGSIMSLYNEKRWFGAQLRYNFK
ncbi:MAG: TonB-dependent receptor [Sphingobium sp.]